MHRNASVDSFFNLAVGDNLPDSFDYGDEYLPEDLAY